MPPVNGFFCCACTTICCDFGYISVNVMRVYTLIKMSLYSEIKHMLSFGFLMVVLIIYGPENLTKITKITFGRQHIV